MMGFVFFQISTFLFVGLVLLISLAWIAIRYPREQYQLDRWWFLPGFILLAAMALFTVRSYIYPPRSIFGNTKYHILEHQGFEFDSTLALVQARYPETSLWDTRSRDSAEILLTRSGNQAHIDLRNFYEPFYTGPEHNSFTLQNNLITVDISNGFTIRRANIPIFQLKILPGHADSTWYLARVGNSQKFDTSTFSQPISIGYPLIDILLRTPHILISDELRSLLEDALLVRDAIQLDDTTHAAESTRPNKSPLRFFPGRNFWLSSDLAVEDQSCSGQNRRFQIPLRNNSIFFAGIGFTATDILRLRLEEGNKLRLLYILPKMRSLREDNTNTLFITSSEDELKYHDLKGGYLFNIFASDKNLNHINATVRYNSGSSTDALFFRVRDIYAGEQQQEIFPADTVFSLRSLDHTNNLRWLFSFHDLRETNSLRIGHIETFIVVFVLLIILRLFFDTRSPTALFQWRRPAPPVYGSGVTPIELSAYVVLFCLSVVRLILAWRMSTFVPLEDIDAARFFKMRNGYSICSWTLGFVLGFFFLIFLFKLIGNTSEFRYRLSAYWEKGWTRIARLRFAITGNSARFKMVMLFTIIICILYMASKIAPGTLARLLNIPLPVIAYFIFDYFLLKRSGEDPDADLTLPRFGRIYLYMYQHYARVVLWLVTFVYLAIQDSGFSVIFLLYGLLHHLFSKFFLSDTEKGRTNWVGLGSILLISAAFWFFLHHESEFILGVFTHTFAWTITLAIVFLILGWFIGTNPYFSARVKDLPGRYIVATALFLAGLTLPLTSGKISSYLNNNKSYVKYRAEIQLPGVGIEDLIAQHQFRSSDITYILRSAHNQWFINLYNSQPPDRYFSLQPHFNQGSSFTTQTTDLVVTRYLLAEHPLLVIILLMLFFGSLAVIYSLTLNLKKHRDNFSLLGVFLLLYAIAFFVFLAATNRVVFFGQDFPFISLTSRIAIAFPLLIFLVAILNSWRSDVTGIRYEDYRQSQKLMFVASIFAITLVCTLLIHPRNQEKNETHFNISGLVGKMAYKVEDLNNEFIAYQDRPGVSHPNAGIDSLLNSWLRDDAWCQRFSAALKDKNEPFLASLLNRFIDPLTNKWDPNELIHIRKRGEYYNLAVNHQYYFIPSFRENTHQWQGNLLAATVEDRFGFVGKGRRLFVPKTRDGENILGNAAMPSLQVMPELWRYHSQLNNLDIMRLDPSWTGDQTSLYLIRSNTGDNPGNRATFNIYNDTIAVHGQDKYPAIRLFAGDLLEFDVLREGGGRGAIKWSIVSQKDNYLARSLWLNGAQSLFYPLGARSMWSYNFANLVRKAWSDSLHIQPADRNLRVSIDYELTQKIYEIIDNANRNHLDISDAARDQLIKFMNLPLDEKRKRGNGTGVWLHDRLLELDVSGYRQAPELKAAIADINKGFHPAGNDDYNTALDRQIASATQRQFDYSAVVLDGYGRIRALSDYSRYVRSDPNKIKDFNRFLSDMYRESSVAVEKDFFGNRALQTINPGPGSSFKPIAFTAVTSKINFGWEGLQLEESSISNAFDSKKTTPKIAFIAFYGGKSFRTPIQPTLLEPYWHLYQNEIHAGLSENTYLTNSNNLFHSVIILLGSQEEEFLRRIKNGRYDQLFTDITGKPKRDAYTFPVIRYQGRDLIFDPTKWLVGEHYFGNQHSVLATGLQDNFRLPETNLQTSESAYDNAFGDDSLFGSLFRSGNSSSFIWSYPERSSFNQQDRTNNPPIRNGLVQPTLGSFPIKVTPLEMATMGMRLATLNRADGVTTLAPDSATRPYRFFLLDTKGWDTAHFLDFYRENVLKQLHEVLLTGTARKLSGTVGKYARLGYYFYAKTGTIGVQGGEEKDERGKHLLVIITNQQLDDPRVPLTPSRLQHLRYYILYMSYHGIGMKDFPEPGQFDNFIFSNYGKVIDAVMSSELFTKYMQQGQ